MPRITEIEQLRDELLHAYDRVKVDPTRASEVRELANTADLIIASLKVELEYAALRGEKPQIPFLGCIHGKEKRGSGPGKKFHVREARDA